ncbi:hypothetical protein BGZ82_010620 [Podila clonocystis]|nr:hypothetical protein BGZ82_010620 [Podila clonocystis]
MGKTQAGKSTLIEYIKNYVNPSYAIDKSLLGDGNLSKAESTRPFYVESNLPVYEVYRKDTGEVIDLEDLPSKFEDEEDYRDILFLRERDVGLRQAPQDRRNLVDNIEFRLLDSLGLENARENDSDHAAMIINKLIHIQTFNLIVITESYKNLLTQEQQLELEYFANVFKGLHSRIMFLHTHVDYTNIHPTNSTLHRNVRMKNKALSKLFRRHDNEVPFDENNFEEYPSLTIDLVSKKRPVINCLIQHTIRKILQMATRPAVIFDNSIHNIERIRAIPYPIQMTDEQLKQAKARLQEDADKFEEEQAEEQAVEQAKVLVEEEEVQAEKPVETSSVMPAVSNRSSWFRRAMEGAVAGGVGAVAVGVAVAVGASASVAYGALTKVDGVWKRTVQVLTTRKAHVDAIAPIAKTSYVYYDEEEAMIEEEAQQETVVTEVVVETGSVKPAVAKGSSWFKKAVGGAVAVGASAAVAHGAHHVASGAGHAASGALKKVDGVWKRTVQTSCVYYDEEVYDAVLTEKYTGVTYVTQLLLDSDTQACYVYVRWGETNYNLDGPHKTIEAAKAAFHVTYKEYFGLEWETRETTVSECWTYEFKTYETFEETEYTEEIVEDYEVKEIVAREQQVIVEGNVISSEQSVLSSHDDSAVRTVSEQFVLQDGYASSSSRGGSFGFGGSSSYEYTRTQSEKDTKKSTFLSSLTILYFYFSIPIVANLPTFNAGINADTGKFREVIGAVSTRHGTKMVGSGSGSRGEESSASRSVLILGKTRLGKAAIWSLH